MSRYSRDFESLCQNDLTVQYEELRCLRAQLASLLFPLKRSPARNRRMAGSNPSATRNERNARSQARPAGVNRRAYV
jgi:hypothetical protein